MNRKTLLYSGLAAVSGLTGVGAAWWRMQARDAATDDDQSAKGGAPDAAVQAFWRLSFDAPSGGTLAMESFRGKPLLLNFWATWCPPCVEELPMLDGFYSVNKAKNWQVIGLAVDQPSAVRKWLQAKPLSFPVGMAGMAGTDLSRSLGNTSGGLPFSAVFDAAGKLRHLKTGKVTPEDLALWLKMR